MKDESRLVKRWGNRRWSGVLCVLTESCGWDDIRMFGSVTEVWLRAAQQQGNVPSICCHHLPTLK